MIQLYSPDNTDYKHNGNITLRPSSATVHPILNGAWEASLSHPLDAEGRWKYIVEEAVVKMPSFNGDQLFRIKSREKSDMGITATMEPIFLDAMDDCFLVSVKPSNATGQEALNLMIAPNSKYEAESDIVTLASADFEYMNLIEALNGTEESFLSIWGGEILYDNYKVIVDQHVGSDNGVTLRYGKNIPQNGMSESIDVRNVVTRIYPRAYNGYTLSGNGYVVSSLVGNYPTFKATTITYSDVKMRIDAGEDDEANGIIVCDTQEELDAALIQKCDAEYDAGLDKPTVSISVDMVLLQNTEQYKDFQNLETVSLGDTVHCINSRLEIATDARITELEYDCIRKKVTSVQIGDSEFNYFSSLTSTTTYVDTVVEKGGTIINEDTIQAVTAMLGTLQVGGATLGRNGVFQVMAQNGTIYFRVDEDGTRIESINVTDGTAAHQVEIDGTTGEITATGYITAPNITDLENRVAALENA